jgi:hypothetical protein
LFTPSLFPRLLLPVIFVIAGGGFVGEEAGGGNHRRFGVRYFRHFGLLQTISISYHG